MSTEGVVGGSNKIYTFCANIQEKWIDIALILACVACLAIGVLATKGYLNAIGTVNATYLSYGMYGGAALAFIAEVTKLAVGACKEGGSAPSATHTATTSSRSVTHQASLQAPNSQVSNKLESVKDTCPSLLHPLFAELHTLLTSRSYHTKLDYYTFYYQLSTISEYVLKQKDSTLTEKWKDFLITINGIEFKRERSATHKLDCSIELRRLNGEQMKFKVDKIDSESPEHQNALDEAGEILAEAFEGAEGMQPWSNPENPCFVIREDLPVGGKIFGCIFLRHNQDKIHVHSLARKASAVRLGITEQFTDHLKTILASEAGKKITCDVDLVNIVAMRIYQKLGFRFKTKTATSASMIYNPTAPEDKILTPGAPQ